MMRTKWRATDDPDQALLSVYFWRPDYFYLGHATLIDSSGHHNRGFNQGLGWLVMSVRWHSNKPSAWRRQRR